MSFCARRSGFKNPADRRAMVQDLGATQVFPREDGRGAHRTSTRGFASGRKPNGLNGSQPCLRLRDAPGRYNPARSI